MQGGLCNLIFNLNEFIWENINPNSSLLPIFSYVAPSFKDLKGEYIRKVEEKLKVIGWKLQHEVLEADSFHCAFYVSGIVTRNLIAQYHLPGVGWFDSSVAKEEEGKSLSYVLNDLSPALFLGYLHISEASSNRLEFWRWR
ncbi:MAG: hypothetical protein ACPLZG_13355 [Thermoproteota archaeon]